MVCCNSAADGFNYVTTCLGLVFFALRAFFVLCFLIVAPTSKSFYPLFLLVCSCALLVLCGRGYVKTKE